MKKIARRVLLWAVCAAVLSGCAGQPAGPERSTAEEQKEQSTQENIGAQAAAAGSETVPSETEPVSAGASKRRIPVLPAVGQDLADFIADGWELMDCVELDYNGDGITDYVGVQEQALKTEESMEEDYFPQVRLLFAIASDGPGQYCLDFQEENLIRTRGEGGVFGDPYLPLTAEGTSFTTHAFGGSAWKWSETYTYAYREGTWYLICAEETYGYGPYLTEYSKSDWDSGVRLCRERSSDISDMDGHEGEYEGEQDDDAYDIEYEMRLEAPLTLEQAGKRWWLAPDRVTDWSVKEIVLAEGIELAPEEIKTPKEGNLSHYCDENGLLYTFSNKEPDDIWKYYLAMYRWQDRSLHVLAEGDGIGSHIEEIGVYKDRIYYTTEIIERISYETAQEGKNGIEEADCVVGMRLSRIRMDGTGKETVFEYLYPGTDQPVLEKEPPYMGLIVEISGGEAIIEVYLGNGEPHPVYRMNADGSGLQKIGQIPKQ
ncbi:MAG: hypothetical protein HFI39_07775 [Lachnospiraceae bacterium]|nr:hypothetical protein [Lachnospiraceae bacterium]